MSKILVRFKRKDEEPANVLTDDYSTFDELKESYHKYYTNISDIENYKFILNSREIINYPNKTIVELGIKNKDEILVISSEDDYFKYIKANIFNINIKGNGIELMIQSYDDEKLKDFFNKYFGKININKSNIKFYYNEQQTNPELKLNEIANKEDKEKKIMNIIFVEEKNKEIKDISRIEENIIDNQNNISENRLAQVNFKGEGIDIIIYCYINDKMKYILDIFLEQTNIEKSEIKFFYEEKEVNENLTFIELVNVKDKEKNKMVIHVNEVEDDLAWTCIDSFDYDNQNKSSLLSKIVEVFFKYEEIIMNIYCKNDNKMSDIFDKFLKKINTNNNDIKFFYNEQIINSELILYELANKEDINKKIMNIICSNKILYNIEINYSGQKQKLAFQSKEDELIGPLLYKFISEFNEDKNKGCFVYNAKRLSIDTGLTINDIVSEDDKKSKMLRIYYVNQEGVKGAGFSINNILKNKKINRNDFIDINFIELGEERQEKTIKCNIDDEIGYIFNIFFGYRLKENEELVFYNDLKNINSESIITNIIDKNDRKKRKMTINYSIIKSKIENNSSTDNTKILNDKKPIKKYDLNILYYNENLKNEENKEDNDNCAFFDMNINGTFYGCHNFELFKIVLEKIKNNEKEFILITSGSAAEKINEYCYNFQYIKECYIYCFNVKKYLPLMIKYPKIKGIYNDFGKLKEKLYTIEPMNMKNISSSNLIYFEDYSRIYIKLHYEFIRKYNIYKILKAKNYNEFQLLSFVKKEYPNLLDWVKQLFPNKNEIIIFFKKYVDEKDKSDEKINNILNCDDNILNDNIKSYIKNYTVEGFYYKYLNRFLREGNFNAFRILSSHITKFIFKLYDYREKISTYQSKSDLYRKMYLYPNDVKLYKESIGRVICYPAFTSTSISKNAFTPYKYNEKLELVLLIINQNNTKSVVSIKEFSEYKNEEEYLFFPFSFFKIENVELKEGNIKDPHIIDLTALNSEKPIEEMFSDFMLKVTDNLNPEGLDLLILEKNNTKLIFNPIFLQETKNSKGNCIIL